MRGLEQLFASIEFVEESLFDQLSVDSIARSAYFSTYHYSRLFKAIVGESVMSYVRKRRLTEAADLLAKSDLSILNIAMDCQFESQEAFTRAFKNQFKLTPGKYRKHNEPFRLLHKKKFDQNTWVHRQQVISTEPKIVSKPMMKVIGIPTIYTLEDFNMMTMWSVFKKRRDEIINFVSPENYFGIYENHQENSSEETLFTYLCCKQVNSFEMLPEKMVSRTIQEQTYAVFTHKGSTETMDVSLGYIWGDWLPKSGYLYTDKPDFELFSDRFNPSSEHSEIDLFIPISSASV